MPGTSSDLEEETPAQTPSAAEIAARGWYGKPGRTDGIRVTNVYATTWFLADPLPCSDLADELDLWRYARYYEMSAEQFPRVLYREEVSPDSLRFRRWQFPQTVQRVKAWLFAMPSGQVVAALTVDSSCPLTDTIPLLEDGYYTDISIDGTPLESFVSKVAGDIEGMLCNGDPQLLPERHQLVCAEAAADADAGDIVQRLIYRTDLPARNGFSAIQYPQEMNRREGWLAAVGPYVSVIGGHPEFIENSLFTSVVQAVAAWARLRESRQRAYQHIRRFRREGQREHHKPPTGPGTDHRGTRGPGA